MMRAKDGLIIGICNGFQALVKSGLLPYGEFRDSSDIECTLYRNDINRHISTMAKTIQVSDNSPWLNTEGMQQVDVIAISHGEGKFVCSEEMLKELLANGQIAFQYCDENGLASNAANVNYNGSMYSIEGLISQDGHILGKMGHSERFSGDNFKNIYGNKEQKIFKNGVNYFKKGAQND